MFLLHETSSSGMFLDFSPEQTTFHALPKVYNTQTLLITLPRFCSYIYIYIHMKKLAINCRKKLRTLYFIHIPRRAKKRRTSAPYNTSRPSYTSLPRVLSTSVFHFFNGDSRSPLFLPFFFLTIRAYLPSATCPFFDFFSFTLTEIFKLLSLCLFRCLRFHVRFALVYMYMLCAQNQMYVYESNLKIG